jgi:RimJ/RimL family protein N-acetyltransferase
MSGRVDLREVEDADLPILYEHQRDPESVRMAAFPSREHEAFVAHWAKIRADASTMTRAVLFDGQVAGNVLSFELGGVRMVGYWLGREYWGKGIATRALAAFLDQIETRPLYAHVAKHNLASLRVLEKCGFRICGEELGGADDEGKPVEDWVLRLPPP